MLPSSRRRATDERLVSELRDIQNRHGFLPEAELRELSRRARTPLYRLEAVASFFPHFRRNAPAGRELSVCTDIACHLRGSAALLAAARSAAPRDTKVSPCACLGQCDRPIATMLGHDVFTGLEGPALIALARGKSAKLMAPAPPTGEYQIASGGSPYEALERVAAKKVDAPRELDASGLRGMGGAGFPTGKKWQLVRDFEADEKFVICNADESEPGTFKDRFLLELFPDLVVEGLAIAAEVVGARRGYVYIRHEYPLQAVAVQAAIDRFHASAHGRRVQLSVFESPGGYICGEETALLEAMEGKRAEPRNKPPYPGTHGLWGKPTVINNVETLAWVPSILLRSGDWFAAQGVGGAKGLKFIGLSGHVEHPGVYEVPLGIRAIDFIEQQGGGVSQQRRLKAITPGGASSGFLPATLADTRLDFQSLQKVGSMLGSGAVVAFAEGTCMLDVAINYLRFFRDESCGKCVPCRVGTEKMTVLTNSLARGEASELDLVALADLRTAMELTSICGLGQAAPAPLTSVLQHFSGEVKAHASGHCPEGIKHG